MNLIKNTIKVALIGTAFGSLSLLASCSCGSNPDPVKTIEYVVPEK